LQIRTTCSLAIAPDRFLGDQWAESMRQLGSSAAAGLEPQSKGRATGEYRNILLKELVSETERHLI